MSGINRFESNGGTDDEGNPRRDLKKMLEEQFESKPIEPVGQSAEHGSLKAADLDALKAAWDAATSVDDRKPVKPGTYIATVSETRQRTTSKGNLSCEIPFTVEGGEHAERRILHWITITPKTMPFARPDLGRLGITRLDQIGSALPSRLRCKIDVTVTRNDDGREWNRISRFTVLGADKPEANPCAPRPASGAGDAA